MIHRLRPRTDDRTAPRTRVERFRTLELFGRTGWGLLLLVAPRSVLSVVGGPASRHGDPRAVTVARVLGGHHLLQAAVTVLVPGRLERDLSALVDGVHAVAALALAVGDREHARGALVDAAVAAGWCLTTRWTR